MSTERRAEILRAAREIAMRGGLAAISVRSVAAEAGIGASTLRHYFPTQRELHDAVAAALMDEQLDDLRIADAGLDPAARLTECLAQFLPQSDERIHDLDRWLALHHAVRKGEADPAPLAAMSARAAERIDAWLETLAEEGVLRDAPRQRHLATVLAVVDGVCLGLLTGTSLATVADALEVVDATVRHTVVASGRAP
ncbi:TetR/AcrR family transcriptional regulator [Egibacter rhizosphaerae]|uniref:TetR/AcrR family transcriptional regulator n=1 Tax=Egibacter rhizosphaerae TaxID=1670831 RepID=A0A411YBA8_9ACTN|nr:TetR/AcrR family transcriptional regulator [Egibacter rhizosphaerae]QBI18465.1 TetR/AcrR family transcriptional regulator [Egibacter rhizosphaerae]